MPTNLALDNKLIEEARRVGHNKTKKEPVTAVLTQYVAHKKRLEILPLFGTIDFDSKYNYKASRRSKR